MLLLMMTMMTMMMVMMMMMMMPMMMLVMVMMMMMIMRKMMPMMMVDNRGSNEKYPSETKKLPLAACQVSPLVVHLSVLSHNHRCCYHQQ